MKLKAVIKLAVDVSMTIALLFLMGYQFWGEVPHEWVGVGIFLLFIFHHILNRYWHKSLFKGKYSAMRILILCIDFFVMIAMFAQMYSGIVMSRYVFHFLPFSNGMALARRLHILGSYWGFLFISLHLGIHWDSILGVICNTAKIKCNSKVCRIIAFIMGLLISCYGICVFISRDFLTYLFLKSEFVFWDYSEPKILFYIDYLAFMGFCIFIAYYSTKIIRKLKKTKEQQ